ncbi:MAG: hypothetical protein IT431_02435 [Phycisphaerales bacterium]|nr:hypothetical protein [Phycisphaerales bacterium]
MRLVRCGAVLPALAILAGCFGGREGGEMLRPAVEHVLGPAARQMSAFEFVEILPGVRINQEIRTLEFDATVAIDCHDPETPDVYLEVICCTRDTREHEALVVTGVSPSSVHAALLALGGEPGRPGGWRREGDAIVSVPPEGDRVRVWFFVATDDGSIRVSEPTQWIIQHETRRPLTSWATDPGWVFAGSRIRQYQGREVYDADGTGQLIGLHTFGSEVIGWTRVESPEAAVDEPQWLANSDLVPPIGTPVRVRIELVSGDDRP